MWPDGWCAGIEEGRKGCIRQGGGVATGFPTSVPLGYYVHVALVMFSSNLVFEMAAATDATLPLWSCALLSHWCCSILKF